MKLTPRQQYISDYFEDHYESELQDGLCTETKLYGRFLASNIRGKTLDFGCGPSIHFNAMFMPNATTIDGIDWVPENLEFARQQIASFDPTRYKVMEDFVHSLGAISDYSLDKQIQKIRQLIVADFSKPLPPTLEQGSYDCVAATFSLGSVKNIEQYKAAILNIHTLLRPGGVMLCLGTDGRNHDPRMPEMTYNGLELPGDGLEFLGQFAKELGFTNIKQERIELPKEELEGEMYKHSALLLTSAQKSD